ncbi:PREDICTED: uncharacterized protein LOC104602986 isoform X2 [Nelumbo nucifera]|uniref:Uncharacterized protein LOC104602986 isoform X2 n=1 Tax=Nelumbo nucifera TaxID=4432 RepID=A0A1U8ADZ9_NELNU|nr:PREDICTED: uncharacterized protein LOC104602986 isoform X2 [Nelumbo nucifera]
MGRRLDALLGRTFKTYKFKALVNLAISRLAILKNQRQVRCSQARSDVVQLLNLGHHERALLRVEHVIKDQNMLDVFIMIEGYCNLMIERVVLIENNKECPDELKEAISSLIFAASRCGEFPELQEIRAVFTSRFGKEFAARAVELRNSCEVNLKMIQKMSTRSANTESRMKVLKEIATDSGITLHLEEVSSDATKEKLERNQRKNHPKQGPSVNLDDAGLGEKTHSFAEEKERDEQFTPRSMKSRKYRDVATAAQDAFESAAFAAAAARAAVELSRSESRDKDPDDNSGSTTRGGASFKASSGVPSGNITGREVEVEKLIGGSSFEKIHSVDNSGSESEGEELENNSEKIHLEEFKDGKEKAELERSPSDSSSDSAGDSLKETEIPHNQPPEKIFFDESDNEGRNEQGTISRAKQLHSGFSGKSSVTSNEAPKLRGFGGVKDEYMPDDSNDVKLHHPSQNTLRYQAADQHKHGQVNVLGSRNEETSISYSGARSRLGTTHHLDSEERTSPNDPKVGMMPVSVRTRRVHRQ